MQKIVFLTGPTAVGKSAVGFYLAKKINAEIISCDSMQVYRGMDIITSKPSSAMRKGIAHHMLGVVSPLKDYNVSQYRRAALGKIKTILKKGKIPLFIGGTGLYIWCLIDGIFQAKTEDASLRRRLYRQAESKGSQALHSKLARIDSLAASRIHPNDTKRIIRALEVFAVTGRPISQLQKERKGLSATFAIKIFCLTRKRRELYRRIEERVDEMFRQGLLQEAKGLLKKKLGRTASGAIGLKELGDYLQGRCDLEQAKSLISRNSRRYAKRQLTWFRKDKRVEWIHIGKKQKPQQVAKELAKRIWSVHS